MKATHLHLLPKLLLFVLGALCLILIGVGVVRVIASPFQNPPLPAAKQTIEANYEKDRQEGLKHQTPGRNFIDPQLPTSPRPSPTLIVGIQNLHQSLLNKDEFYVENQWWGYFNGKIIGVYAGTLKKDPDQGFIGVVSGLPAGTGNPNFKFEQYFPPTKSGILRISAERDLQLTLVSKQDAAFTFDIPSRSFK